jgi:hypothetical protein
MDTKEEFYKSFIEVQLKCGQGLSGIVRVMGGANIDRWMDELIEEGLMKACDTGGSIGHPESNIFYMPTKGYNVWEDEDPKEYSRHKGRYLHCVRYYLDCLEEGEKERYTRDVDFMKEYAKWLERNEKALDIMLKLDTFYASPVIKFSKDEVKWVKTKEWYEKDLTIAQCIKQVAEGMANDVEQISINERLIVLYKELNNSETPRKVTDSEKDIIETEKNIITRKKLNNWFESQNKKEKIQTCFKF